MSSHMWIDCIMIPTTCKIKWIGCKKLKMLKKQQIILFWFSQKRRSAAF